MMRMMKDKVIQAIKENKLYDFIANHYWEMDRCDLKDIILELDYILYDRQINDDVILEDLQSRWDIEEEMYKGFEEELESWYQDGLQAKS